jgi:outer membrane biosynthesis protein TonB
MERECLNCKTRFLKVEDCNKMTCPKCKNKMCYICLTTVSDYSHFYGQSAKPIDGKCPLYTQSSTSTPNMPPKKKFCGQTVEDSDPKYPLKEAVEPVKPGEPVKPVEPVEPGEPIKAVEPVKPVESIEAVNPVQPVKSVESVESVHEEPVESMDLVQPVAPPRKNPRINRICCVVECHNRAGRENVIFFAFPKKNQSQKEKWIKAVNRINQDKTPWRPTISSFVCSDHFVGNKKSTIENHPDYVPSKFPTSHVIPKSVSDVLRHKRVSFSVALLLFIRQHVVLARLLYPLCCCCSL